ncbi:hypothetical protein GW17_00053101, partial [Ensete ventricosum]
GPSGPAPQRALAPPSHDVPLRVALARRKEEQAKPWALPSKQSGALAPSPTLAHGHLKGNARVSRRWAVVTNAT